MTSDLPPAEGERPERYRNTPLTGMLARLTSDPPQHSMSFPRTVDTGLDVLNEALLGGLRFGQLTLIAGLTGSGTSMLALGIARTAVLRQGIPTLVVAPDSGEDEVAARILCAETKVPLQHL